MSKQKPRRNKKMHPIPRDLYDQHQAALAAPAGGGKPPTPPRRYGTVFPEPSTPPPRPGEVRLHPGTPSKSGRLVSAIRRHPGRTAAVVAGTAAAGVGTAVLIDRHNKQKKAAAMSKNWINPFEEVVVFGKAYTVVSETNVRYTGSLVHTGKHVGHGQRLTEVKNSSGGGGKATKLERYAGGHSSQRVGPFGKSLSFSGLKRAKKAAAVVPAPYVPHSMVKTGQTPSWAGGPKTRQLADRRVDKSLLSTAGQRTLTGLKTIKPVKVPSKIPLPPSSSLRPTRSIGAIHLGKGMDFGCRSHVGKAIR